MKTLTDYRAFIRAKTKHDTLAGFEVDERDLNPRMRVDQRAIRLWTSAGDAVLDPFAGIGSVPYVAVGMNRCGVGIELKESYFKWACRYIEDAERVAKTETLFDLAV